jgi:hypothetical protein
LSDIDGKINLHVVELSEVCSCLFCVALFYVMLRCVVYVYVFVLFYMDFETKRGSRSKEIFMSSYIKGKK